MKLKDGMLLKRDDDVGLVLEFNDMWLFKFIGGHNHRIQALDASTVAHLENEDDWKCIGNISTFGELISKSDIKGT